MPTYEEMRTLLVNRMKDAGGGDLTADFNGRQITVDRDPHFKSFANMGAFLSTAGHRPQLLSALQSLENDMVNEIGGIWIWSNKKAAAKQHFDSQATAFADRTGATRVADRADFRGLLNKALERFERAHGFTVPAKLPIFAGFVYGNVFKDTILNKMHFKDVGAGEKHGEFTHRIQWYMLIKAGAMVTAEPQRAADVYSAIHRWLNKRQGPGLPLLQLWNYIFDMQPALATAGDVLAADDFRSPENLNLWLTSDADADFCPLLRSFLRTRRTKRQSYMIDSYFKKKLGDDRGSAAYDAWLLSQANKENPSARIVYDAERVGSYKPRV